MKYYNELASQVEDVIRKHSGMGVDINIIGTKKGACIKVKHLSIFILHTIYHVPISWLSKHYDVSIRHTFRLISQIHDYAKYSSSYREECKSLVRMLELEGITS